MQILDFSTKRGIHAIFNGYGKQAYVFHSSFYGFIGYADVDDEPGSKSITVKLYVCNGSKLWTVFNLIPILKRGISKNEHQFIDKQIVYEIHYLDKVYGTTPGYETCIGSPNARFELELYKDVKEI